MAKYQGQSLAGLCAAATGSTHFSDTLICWITPLLEGGLCLSPFSLSASAIKSAGGDEERQSTGGKLVDPKYWIQAKLDLWMPQTVLQCRFSFRIIYFKSLASYPCTYILAN